MFAVIYDPEDGRIIQTKSASPIAMAQDSRPWIEVEEHRLDYDVTHMVIDGQLVEREG